jgi:hypothetical protein
MTKKEIIKDLKQNCSKDVNIILEYKEHLKSFICKTNKERDKVGQAYLEAKKEEKDGLADKMIALTSNLMVALKLSDMFNETALKWGLDLEELYGENE